MKGEIGEYYYCLWVLFVGIFFLFIFVVNWLGVLVFWKLIYLLEGELVVLINDINIMVVLLLLILISYFYVGFKEKGFGFFVRYILLILFFLLINILEDFLKLLLLSFCFFGNVVVDEIVVLVLCLLVLLFILLLVMVFGVFVSFV